MPALELLTGFATAPGAIFTPLTMAAQNSLTIRNAPEADRPLLLTTWQDKQAVGNFRIRSPKMHDNVQGINMTDIVSELSPSMPMGIPQMLYPQDTLTAEITGSAVGGDIETACMLIYYPTLPGSEARFIDPATLKTRAKNLMTSQNTLAFGAAGGYSGSQAINTTNDLMKANTDYALVGYQCRIECAAIRWLGADLGNLGVGGPGSLIFRRSTARWFITLSEEFGLPLIPVFNSANKAGILIDGAQDENAAASVVSSIFVELGA